MGSSLDVKELRNFYIRKFVRMFEKCWRTDSPGSYTILHGFLGFKNI